MFLDLLNLFQDMNRSAQPQLVKNIINAMTTTDFQDGDQHDCAEFLDKLLDQIHEDTVMYSGDTDLIESTFRIELSDNEQGVACSHRSRQRRSVWSLALPLSTHQLEDVNLLLQKIVKKSQSVPKSCEACRMKHVMLESSTFEVLPSVLVLQLGRFPCKGNKIEKYVGIPNIMQLQIKSGYKVYELRSIVKHKGTSGGGHYVTATKDPETKQWTEWNDEQVKQITEPEAITNEAYVVIYQIQS